MFTKKFPTYIQMDITDCGPTCLRMISKYYGKSFSNEYLRNISNKSRLGTNLLGLSEAAETLGFKTYGLKITAEDLHEVPLPCIAFWKQTHFLIIYKVTKTHIFVSDPAQGLLEYKHDEFLRFWGTKEKEGVVLLLEPTEEFYKSDDQKIDLKKQSSFHRVFTYLFKYKQLLVQIFLGIICTSVLQLMFPLLTQSIIDIGIAQNNISFIYLILFGQLFIFIGRISIEVLRRFVLIHISSRINLALLSDFFLKLLKLPLDYFDVKMTGDVLQRIFDHEKVESFITSGILNILFSALSLIIFGGVLAYYNLVIFSIYLLGACLFFAWVYLFLEKRAVLDYKRFNQLSTNNEKSIEFIQGMQEIKLNNAELKKRWEWEYFQAKLFKINISTLRIEQIQNVGAFLINELTSIAITIYTATLVIQGELTLGMMLAISYIVGQINAPILQLISVLNLYQDAKLSMERINELHNKEDEESKVENYVNYNVNNDIKLNNLSFKYDNSKRGQLILENINETIPANKVTAIVGSSGSGKTTLMKLLLKVYNPYEGSITIGDANLNQVSHKKWRDSCGSVMQEGFLFNDTVANNISLGAERPNMDKVIQASKIANIYDFIISLPLGFDTKVGSSGLAISTGQKQRILIARAVYKDPDILFFDEATSALDANNERKIVESLDKFFVGKTVVVIAHRLSTVRNADKILVMEEGKIIESGTHEKLIENKNIYYNLVKNQLELDK